ncbi:hypothetical protein FNF31_03318 [Cafeteria roenbergensis]|uniref:Prokaryotic-type class I peptide chain release factors domain-containing protein n=1 Tax=Cafeteria roenbergensis TaxID=33653 RepID=A0A5A8DA71_CAFRO|nr:hypothetical protein FNF31_03318 [Cafeteria roenbergensis]
MIRAGRLALGLSRASGNAGAFASAFHSSALPRGSWAGSDSPPFFVEADLREQFTKGGGKGGQGVNKSSNAVLLQHVPTGTAVKVHTHRALVDNRKEARALLRQKLDLKLHGADSKAGQQQSKLQRAKQTAARRAREKYGATEGKAAASAQADSSAQPPKAPAGRRNSAARVREQLAHLRD